MQHLFLRRLCAVYDIQQAFNLLNIIGLWVVLDSNQ